MFGAQVGYRIPFSDAVKLTVAGTYFDFDGVQGYNPLFGGSSFGNTTTTSAAVCNRTLAARYGLSAVRLRRRSKCSRTSRRRSAASRCASSPTTRRTPPPK